MEFNISEKTIEIQMTRGLIKLALKSFKVYLILSLEYITGWKEMTTREHLEMVYSCCVSATKY